MKLKLVPNWHQAWKWASVQLAFVVAVLTGVIVSNQGLLLGLIDRLPEGRWRTVLSAGTTVIVFGLPVLTRVIQKCVADDKPADADQVTHG